MSRNAFPQIERETAIEMECLENAASRLYCQGCPNREGQECAAYAEPLHGNGKGDFYRLHICGLNSTKETAYDSPCRPGLSA